MVRELNRSRYPHQIWSKLQMKRGYLLCIAAVSIFRETTQFRPETPHRHIYEKTNHKKVNSAGLKSNNGVYNDKLTMHPTVLFHVSVYRVFPAILPLLCTLDYNSAAILCLPEGSFMYGQTKSTRHQPQRKV